MNLYGSLSYEEYKELERQMKTFAETSHTSEEGYYHKSIRLKIATDLTLEFHGPIVHAGEPSATEKRILMIQRPPAVAPEGLLQEERREGPSERRQAVGNASGLVRRGAGFGRRRDDTHYYRSGP